MNQQVPPINAAYPTAEKTNALAIISMILGILGVVTSCPAVFFPFLLLCNGPFSLAALITGLISLNQIKKTGETEKGRGMAIAGTVLGVVVVLAACAYTVLVLLVVFGVISLPFISNAVNSVYPGLR
jgi:uncharacterized membrane protein